MRVGVLAVPEMRRLGGLIQFCGIGGRGTHQRILEIIWRGARGFQLSQGFMKPVPLLLWWVLFFASVGASAASMGTETESVYAATATPARVPEDAAVIVAGVGRRRQKRVRRMRRMGEGGDEVRMGMRIGGRRV